MAIASFSPPKDWEDWATLLLGLWLWVSPVLMGFEDAAASPHFYVVGFLVIVCELFAFYFFRTWEEWINIVLGLWLIFAALFLFTARAGTNRCHRRRSPACCALGLRNVGGSKANGCRGVGMIVARREPGS